MGKSRLYSIGHPSFGYTYGEKNSIIGIFTITLGLDSCALHQFDRTAYRIEKKTDIPNQIGRFFSCRRRMEQRVNVGLRLGYSQTAGDDMLQSGAAGSIILQSEQSTGVTF